MGESDAGPLRLGTARDLAEPVKQAGKYHHAEQTIRVVLWLPGPEIAARVRAIALEEARRRRVVIRDSWLNLGAGAASRLIVAAAEACRVRGISDDERRQQIRAAVEREVGS